MALMTSLEKRDSCRLNNVLDCNAHGSLLCGNVLLLTSQVDRLGNVCLRAFNITILYEVTVIAKDCNV